MHTTPVAGAETGETNDPWYAETTTAAGRARTIAHAQADAITEPL
jgi:hypothetical protein